MAFKNVLAQDRDKDLYVQQLVEFLKIPSVSARSEHKGDMRRCAEWLGAELDRRGVAAEILSTPGHPIVYGAAALAPMILIRKSWNPRCWPRAPSWSMYSSSVRPLATSIMPSR